MRLLREGSLPRLRRRSLPFFHIVPGDCRFAEKRVFRPLQAGRRCAAASRFTFFKGETLWGVLTLNRFSGGKETPLSLLSMPVASCVATGTACGRLRSRLAHKGPAFPQERRSRNSSPQAPHPSPNALFQRGHRTGGKRLSLVLAGPSRDKRPAAPAVALPADARGQNPASAD